MDSTQIPFAKHTGLENKDESTLQLKPTLVVQNHMNTIHAAAQFTLAETQSGLYMQKAFPALKNKVIALLRASTVKFKTPATSILTAYAHVETIDKEKFSILFEKKGRASITVTVELKDIEDVITMQGEFVWFVQKLEA